MPVQCPLLINVRAGTGDRSKRHSITFVSLLLLTVFVLVEDDNPLSETHNIINYCWGRCVYQAANSF